MPTKRPAAPHHTAPCQHPTASGAPCPNKARTHHPEHGPVCLLHGHHADTSEGRTATILVHLAPEEKRAVQIAAEALNSTMSDVARAMLLGLELPPPPRPRIDVMTHGELGRLAGNLNQVARNLNLFVMVGSEAEAIDLVQLRTEVRDLTALCRSLQAGLADA